MPFSRLQLARILLGMVLLLPSGYLFWQARSGAHLGRLQDDGIYLVSARSMLRGEYRIDSLPGQPYQTKYPPLYPFVLSAIWRFAPAFPANLKWAVVLNWLIWLMFLGVSVLLFRRMLPDSKLRWIAFLLLATHAVCVIYALQIMCDALVAALVLAAILLATKSSETLGGKVLATGAGLASALAFLTKTAAWPLLITAPLVFVAKRQYGRAALFAIASFPPAIAWILWSAAHRVHTSDPVLLYYTDYLGFYRATVTKPILATVLTDNFTGLLDTVSSLALGLRSAPTRVSLLLSLFCIAGFVRVCSRIRCPQLAVFVPLYSIQFVLWNYLPNERFLLPLAPVLIATAVSEAGVAARHFRHAFDRRWIPITVVAAFAACLANGTVWQSPAGYAQISGIIRSTGEPLAGKMAACSWLAANTPKDSTIVAYDDPTTYLLSGRRAIRNQNMPQGYYMRSIPVIEAPLAHMAEFARQHSANYVMWAPDDYAVSAVVRDRARQQKFIGQNRQLEKVYDRKGVRIYAVTPSASDSQQLRADSYSVY